MIDSREDDPVTYILCVQGQLKTSQDWVGVVYTAPRGMSTPRYDHCDLPGINGPWQSLTSAPL